MDQQPSARSCSRAAAACELLPNEPSMNLHIHTTTGARYELCVPLDETVEGLKRRLSQRLKVPKERLALLHKESRLSCGKLQDLGVAEGSKLTLVPTVEAGLMSQASRPEQSVMQALESLTETQVRGLMLAHGWRQRALCGWLGGRDCCDLPRRPLPSGFGVNDFLSGRSPLTLALRVGDHMMFVQLQLAAQQSSGQLQHRHVIASRGEAGAASAHCRALHGAAGSGFARVPVVPACQQSPAPATPSVVSSCSEVSSADSSSSPGGSPAPTPRSRKPGAVIESFVNHAPGVFSGTFSGTLHPNCQDSSGRPRRDIGTILQILNDLLSATRHYQGMPQSLTQLRCQTQFSSTASSSPDLATKTTSEPLPAPATSAPLHPVVQCQSQIRMCKPSGDRLRQTENRATRCKVERLQLLMQQKRLRRKARRDARGPYHWLPNRKSSRTNSNSSVSSEGSLDLDFEDSVWKPEVKADMKSEFVVA
uniref:Midnolin n=1 Tax=Nothoprocta perdicaria TaxID=30464 RepID=A0A8C6YRR6_NOTPE